LSVRQSAYPHYHSTETAVVIVYNDIVRSIDRREDVPLVLLDLSSAFDTVDHDCLTSIFRDRFSVAGVALSWFQSYLSGRTHTFMSEDDRSGPFTVCCSVPQGSVLGLIEFISYTEDVVELFDRHGVSHHLFADDTLVLFPVNLSAVATVSRLATVTCKNGARRASSNSVPPRRSFSGSALGPLSVD